MQNITSRDRYVGRSCGQNLALYNNMGNQTILLTRFSSIDKSCDMFYYLRHEYSYE